MIGVLVGPTAVGKSALAVALAAQSTAAGQPAEIISADSMAVYRGMDIGTAKPTPQERAAVPHHLIDVLEIDQSATVAEFQAMARRALEDCAARGVLPIVVGGSALYVRAIVDQFEFPGTDSGVRDQLEQELERVGPSALHERLANLDPEAAARIPPNNARRVVRALEVIQLDRPALPGCAAGTDLCAARSGADRPGHRPTHLGRADRGAGAADVGARFRCRGGWDSPTGVSATAAPHPGPWATARCWTSSTGSIGEQEALTATVRATRRFARRQDSWFRRDPRISWLRYDRPDLVHAARTLLPGMGG